MIRLVLSACTAVLAAAALLALVASDLFARLVLAGMGILVLVCVGMIATVTMWLMGRIAWRGIRRWWRFVHRRPVPPASSHHSHVHVAMRSPGGDVDALLSELDWDFPTPTPRESGTGQMADVIKMPAVEWSDMRVAA